MTIKIASLNIWFGGHLLDEAVSFLKAQNADIIFLQEVYNGEDLALEPRYRTMQVLKERLNFPYEAFAPNYNQPDENANIGNAIVSRFPSISSKPENFFFHEEDGIDLTNADYRHLYNLQHVTVNTPLGELDLLNLHGPWDLDGNNFSPIRQDMSSRIIKMSENKKYAILAGDTNAKPSNEAMVTIGKHLKSVFGGELKTTFNMNRKDDEGYATAAVDMIFVSPNIQDIEHSCPSVDISDHMPLVATLQLSE